GKALRGLAASGRTLLFTSHDDDFVRDYSTRVVVLAEGRVVEEGEPRQVLTRPKHEATRQLLQVEPEKRRAKATASSVKNR
ncbi:MAG: L-cystine ABC transporter ATP-binding protein YecC, partial [Vicinamibacteria bacterium]